jgi:dTDP-4-amino-4,6-dideoxygalactose transaminase
MPPHRVAHCNPGWHLYAVRIDFAAAGLSRAALMHRLKDRNIGTQVHYIPVHGQPYYRDLYGAQDLPGARHYYEHTLSLPLFPAMTDDDARFVVDALRAETGA